MPNNTIHHTTEIKPLFIAHTNPWLRSPYVSINAGPMINNTGVPTTYVGLNGGVSFGYEALLNSWFFLAVEILGNDSLQFQDAHSVVNPALDTRTKTGWTYALDALPGVRINETSLVYFRAGGSRAHFSTSSVYKATSTWGWQIGLGTQTQILKHLDLRLEYVLSKYQPQSYTIQADPVVTLASQANVYSSQMNLGAVYKFNA